MEAGQATAAPGRLSNELAGAALAELPALVRLSDDSPTSIQYALDGGAAGVRVAHGYLQRDADIRGGGRAAGGVGVPYQRQPGGVPDRLPGRTLKEEA